MGKKRSKALKRKKEEEQAKRVIRIVFVSLAILGLLMIIGFALYS